ncbi:hypothetical protein EG834_13860, partial [bacterium]|nr:hypothetical protein [bacterium]
VWHQGPNLPVVYDEIRAAVLSGGLYVVGGRTGQGAGSTCVNTVLFYQPSTNQWSYVAPLPEKLAAVGVAAHGGYLYCFGGINEPYWWGWPVRSAYRYNPTNNAWTRLSEMPIARSNFGIAVLGNMIYCAGGNVHWPNATRRVDVYDTTTGTWSTVTDMPGARGGPVCGAWADKLVVAMGLVSASSSSSKTVLVYDPQTSQWTQTALIDTLGHESGSLFADHTGLYCMGERNGATQPTCISRLHPDTGQVDFLTPASPLVQEGVMAQAYDPIRGICYAVGGWTTSRTPTFQMGIVSTGSPGSTVSLASGTDGKGGLLTLNVPDAFTRYTSSSHPVITNAVVGKGQPIGPYVADYLGRGRSQAVTVDNLADTWADFTVRFTLPPSSAYTLDLDCIADDGARVYLNGNLLGTSEQRDTQNN